MKHTTTIGAETGFGLAEQTFEIKGVTPGTYSLVISKAAHMQFTVQNIIVGDSDIDLTNDSHPEIQLMSLQCGDINGDGMINDSDLTVLWKQSNYNRKSGDATDTQCDLDGDGMINDKDLTILWLNTNYNKNPVIIDFMRLQTPQNLMPHIEKNTLFQWFPDW